jgi:TolA-binding protein
VSLQLQLGKIEDHQFPNDALKFIHQYEQLTAAQRERLSPDQFARATWIYYVQALRDLDKGNTAPAMQKFDACLTSPDDFIAADAGYRLGQMHMQQGNFAKAREVFEYLLFATRSSESAVRATFALGQCLEKLDKPDEAVARYAQLIQRYPISPFVDRIKALPVYKQVEEKLKTKTETTPHAAN